MLNQSLNDWFETPLGRYLLEQERAYFDRVVADVFGFHAMQIGLHQVDFLRASRMPFCFTAGTENGAQVRSDPRQLPIASNSIDLVIIPHVLEFNPHPHQILREVERVLVPEGQVIIAGFNPWSLWGARRLLQRAKHDYPWCGNYISLLRIKDWLALLGLEVAGGRLCCYVPPFAQEKWLRRFQFMELAGDRWWAVEGGGYFVQAVKRVRGMTVITPRWSRPVDKKLVAVAQKRAAGASQRSHLRMVWNSDREPGAAS